MPDDRSGDFSGEEDAALVLRVAEHGDREAFVELFNRYAVRVKAFLIKGGAPPDTADEAAQDVMVSLWRRARQYDPAKASVATWIYAIARNRRIDLLRRETRPAPDPEDPLFQPDPPEDPASSAAASRRDARVREAIEGLSAEQRQVVSLTFFSGMTQAEIAEAAGVPLGTVKSRLRLAFGRLRAALGEDFSEELFDD
jgi:RNA polymerase sigma-70 factor (ECF subfamily)